MSSLWPKRNIFTRSVERATRPLKPYFSILYSLVSLILVWEAAGRILQFHPQILPTPSRILLEFSDQAERLRTHGVISAVQIFGGYFLAMACAVPAAIMIALVPGARNFARPVFSMMRSAPMLIAIPVFFVWFGFGIRPGILIAGTLCFMPMLSGITRALSSTPMEMIDVFRVMGATRGQMFRKLVLPCSLPGVFQALKAAVPFAVAGATAGEFAQADAGLGYVMLAASFKLETPLVFAALALLGMMGLLLYAAFVVLRTLAVPWDAEKQG